jgi:amidohydrolase
MALEHLAGEVRQRAEKLDSRIRDIRRRIHRRPELGFQERETAALIANGLRGLGLEVTEGVCRTGVVALLRGEASGGGWPGRTVGLRADMDALPIEEQGKDEYRSETPGVMHACGHDAHVACLMGAAEILHGIRDRFGGTVKLVFQPNEEGQASGALAMAKEGILKDPPVEILVALHVDPELPGGHIGARAGPFLAEARDFDIDILGRSGHGAHPHQGIDAIVLAAHFLTQVHAVVGRRVDPLQSAVISIGEIHGGKADNIIADRVEMTGTLRSLDVDLSDRLVGAVEAILKGVTEAAGARGEIRWSQGCAPLTNDDGAIDAVRRSALQLYGPEILHEDVPQSMGGDDFSYLLQHVPGALFTLGTSDGSESTSHPLHHPMFDIDEEALSVGAAMYAMTALELLYGG